MVGITLGKIMDVSDRIVDFRFFIKFDKSGMKYFSVMGYHRKGELSIKKALNQPYQNHSLLNMVWPLWEVVCMVSNKFDKFDFSLYFTGPDI